MIYPVHNFFCGSCVSCLHQCCDSWTREIVKMSDCFLVPLFRNYCSLLIAQLFVKYKPELLWFIPQYLKQNY